MLGALVIVFREVIEAGIIVGIILAVTKGVGGSRWMAGAGVLAGLIGASLVAAFAGLIANSMRGVGQEVLNASILLFAVGMLIWHNVWMAGHGREMAMEARKLGADVRSGSRSLIALGLVIAAGCCGSYSRCIFQPVQRRQQLLRIPRLERKQRFAGERGPALGVLAGMAVTAVTYLGLVAIPTRYLFSVTTTLITFLAAGLAAQAVVFLQQGGIITAMADTAWDTSAYLSDTSLFGRVLHTLIGYADQPSQLQVVVYAFTLALVMGLSRFAASPRPAATPAKV